MRCLIRLKSRPTGNYNSQLLLANEALIELFKSTACSRQVAVRPVSRDVTTNLDVGQLTFVGNSEATSPLPG